MRIEDDVKLDFKDVLIRPKRSTLTTRSDVDISREFTFRHTGTKYDGSMFHSKTPYAVSKNQGLTGFCSEIRNIS